MLKCLVLMGFFNWGVVYDYVVEEPKDNYYIVLKGFGFNFSGGDKKGY